MKWEFHNLLMQAAQAAKSAPGAKGAKPATASRVVRRWFFHLGGPGLILLGLIDSSVIPVPGSLDAMTIILAAHEKTLWMYYAAMATIGSVLGAFLTYRIARKQGEKALQAKLSARNMKRVTDIFSRWGFFSIALPALLPPPMPMVPFVIAAGAMQYSLKKFLLAMTLGRAVRYAILAYLGAVYGRKIFDVVLAHGWTALYVLIGVSVIAGIVFWFSRTRRKKPAFAAGHD